jgi:hypothetical protein
MPHVVWLALAPLRSLTVVDKSALHLGCIATPDTMVEIRKVDTH